LVEQHGGHKTAQQSPKINGSSKRYNNNSSSRINWSGIESRSATTVITSNWNKTKQQRWERQQLAWNGSSLFGIQREK